MKGNRWRKGLAQAARAYLAKYGTPDERKRYGQNKAPFGDVDGSTFETEDHTTGQRAFDA